MCVCVCVCVCVCGEREREKKREREREREMVKFSLSQITILTHDLAFLNQWILSIHNCRMHDSLDKLNQ